MLISDLLHALEKFEENILELETKFKEDKEHRWFKNYIFMSEKIKDNVRNFLNPLIEEIKEIQTKYSEIYFSKDIKYHTETALRHAQTIKDQLKELVIMYRDQAEYRQIKVQWEISFGPITRKISDLRGRLLIIKRTLSQ